MARPHGPLVWLHGASVGEMISVLPLIERIRAREVAVLVTSGTVTSGGLAEQRLPRGVIHQFVPLDVPRFVRRFLDHWRPDLALFVESDLWPNIMIETSRRAHAADPDQRPAVGALVPAAGSMLPAPSATCSAGSICVWRARRPTPSGSANWARRHVVTTGNLKLDVPAPPADRDKLAALQTRRSPAGR